MFPKPRDWHFFRVGRIRPALWKAIIIGLFVLAGMLLAGISFMAH